MKIPQLVPWVGREEYQAIAECFEQNWITEGPKSKEFAEKLLELSGAKYGVFAPNGTLALYLGLRAMDIKPGDEVIVPDFTFLASATAVEMAGAIPVFVDVNKRNFQIDVKSAQKSVTKKTKAVMPVHIYGTVCDMDDIIKFAKKNKIMIIEDAAEAVGVHWKGQHSGTFGEVGCFSFFADKTITTAEGGFVVTNDDKIYENLLYLRNQGRVDRGSFIHPRVGYNFRMTDLQNAVGLAQLAKLPEIIKRKKHILSEYNKQLKGVKGITFFEPDKGAEWIPFRMLVICENAHDLMSFMKSKGIEPRTFFYPLHRQPAFSVLGGKKQNYGDADFPNSIYGYEHGVCLPIYPTLTDEQIKYICDTIKEFQMGDLFYEYYDVVFKSKDYSKETNTVFDLSEKFGVRSPKKVLEIGSGTGNHTVQVAAKDVELIAIDIDSRMVKVAAEKLLKAGHKNVRVINSPVQSLEENNFDLAFALFNVVTYLDSTEDLESFMKGVAERLKPGGIFVFDLWNGAAAVMDPPKSKKEGVKQDGVLVEYNLDSETDFYNQVTKLNYTLHVTNHKSKKVGSMSFNQTLWMPREITSAVRKAGLEIVLNSPLMEPAKTATEKDWKVMYCVRKPLSER